MKTALAILSSVALLLTVGLQQFSRTPIDHIEMLLMLVVSVVLLGAAGIVHAIEKAADKIIYQFTAERLGAKKAA